MDSKKQKGLRYNTGKIDLSLIPISSLREMGKVMDYGAQKYTVREGGDKNDLSKPILIDGRDQWRSGLGWKSVFSSIQRHLSEWAIGNEVDSESGCLHLGHVMANVAFLIEYYKIYPEGDDRNHKYLNQKRIALDIDGVLANFSKAFKEKAKEMGLIPPHEDLTQYHWDFPSNLQPVWDKIKDDKDFWLNLEPMCDPQFGFDVVAYVSSRNIPKELSEMWLDKFNFPPAPVFHTNGDTKIDILKTLNIDLFVDDSYTNFINLNKSGICTFLFDAEYNRKYDVGYKRLTNLKDLV